jgi:Cu2+-exporting ATPase
MAEVAVSPAAEPATALAPDAGFADPSGYVRTHADGTAELDLVVENLHCPSCIPRIEGAAKRMPGVLDARVNLTTRRLHLSWQRGEVEPAALVGAVSAQGFRLAPYNPVDLKAGSDEAGKALLRAMAVAGFAAGNVMLLSISVWSGMASDMGPATQSLFHWISALIALPAVAYAGLPFYRSAVGALRGGALNMDVPISLAVILAAGMSLFETVQGGDYVYFDAAVMLLFFLLIGRYLDLQVRGKARSAAENLMLLRAVAATVVTADGGHRATPVGDIAPGMRVFVAAGERIPVDGRIVSGRSEVDTSLVTGESVPRAAAVGAEVFAGTLNLGAPLEIEVSAAGDGTLLAEIVRLMEAAEQGRARYVRLADRAARIYAPAVHILAAGTFLGWLAFGGLAWQPALLVAIAVLIITCPCALGLAVPAVQVAAVGRLLRGGVLVKSADGLERLAEADTVVFDKTGTLTLGRPELANRESVDSADLRLAASIATASRHPLARALCRAAGPVRAVAGDVREDPGLGLAATLDGREVRLGSRAWCGIDNADVPAAESELWLAVQDRAPARFGFRDTPRADAAKIVAWLKGQGFAVELLSGDREPVVREVAQALGIEHWAAERKPADKIARLEALAAEGRKVLMVGDGLNDAPALAAAFVSASPSEAADVSQTAADIIVQGEGLAPLGEAIRISVAARQLVMQNFALALSYNAIAVPLAVAGLVTPLIAALAMSASSIVVTLNALRLNLMHRGARP